MSEHAWSDYGSWDDVWEEYVKDQMENTGLNMDDSEHQQPQQVLLQQLAEAESRQTRESGQGDPGDAMDVS